MLGVLRLVAIAAFVLFVLAHRGAYQTIVSLPSEVPEEDARTTYVSVGGTGPQVVLTCPVGIDFSAPGTIGIIDHDMRRVVSVDLAARNISAVQTINLDRRILIKAALFERGRLWTWLQDTTGRAYAIFDLAPVGRDSFDFPGRADLESFAAPSPDIARRLSNLGLNPTYYWAAAASVRFTPPPPSRPTLWSDKVTSPTGQTFEIAYERAGRNEIAISVRNAADGATRNVRVEDFYRVVSANAVKATAAGEVFVAVTSEARSAKVLVHETIVRIPPDANAKPVLYDMPLAQTDCVPPQDYAVSDTGEVFFLKVNESRVALLQIKPRDFLSELGRRIDAFEGFEFNWPRRDLDPDGPSNAFAAARSGFVTVPRGQKITRGDVVRNACEYVTKTWTLSDQSMSPWLDPPPSTYVPSRVKICRDRAAIATDLSRKCRGCVDNREGARWRQSKDLTSNHIGQTITGLPYSWGGADTLAAFDKKVAARRPAGQTCTAGGGDVIPDNASPPTDPDKIFTMGVDCSGFVTRALGFIANDTEGAFHIDTATLATISEEVTFDMCDEGTPCLLPGDIFVKGGSHVRMHFEWVSSLPDSASSDQRPAISAIITESIPAFGVVRQPLLLKEFQGYKRGHIRRVIEPVAATTSGATSAPPTSWTRRDLLCEP